MWNGVVYAKRVVNRLNTSSFIVLTLKLSGLSYFLYFGISWVMPAQITNLLTSWMGGFGKSRAALVWGEVPHCVIWLLWREHNHRVFEGQEVTSLDLKSSFLRTLYEWVSITISPAISSYEEFLDSCNLS